jgi:hypothetical protein
MEGEDPKRHMRSFAQENKNIRQRASDSLKQGQERERCRHAWSLAFPISGHLIHGRRSTEHDTPKKHCKATTGGGADNRTRPLPQAVKGYAQRHRMRAMRPRGRGSADSRASSSGASSVRWLPKEGADGQSQCSRRCFAASEWKRQAGKALHFRHAHQQPCGVLGPCCWMTTRYFYGGAVIQLFIGRI